MRVVVTCSEFGLLEFEPGAIEVLNVEEDIQGYDVIEFVCPSCGETHKSRIYG